MPEEEFSFSYDTHELLERLYLDVLELQARVMTMGSLVSFLLDKNGIPEHKHEEIITSFDADNRGKLMSEDPLLDDYWKKKLKGLGDIPGIKL